MITHEQLTGLRPAFEQQVADALARKAMTNRGTFAPFRLPSTAQALVAGLLASPETPADAAALGTKLGQQGLGLPALLEAQAAAVGVVAGAAGTTPEAIGQVSCYFNRVVEALVAADAAELSRQRADMERAYINATNQQREQEALLRSTISELSTPIIPVYPGVLVLPLVGAVDSRRATEITERLLESIAAYQAEFVIMDVTGVPVIDTSTANHLLMTTRAAGLLGSQVILVGIGAEIAQTIVHIGIELRGLVTLANLQAGIAYALGRIGLAIQPLPSAAGRPRPQQLGADALFARS
ncbi:MAG TPA: STAS domain-containing protein [Kouleothrix sp.]|uniref:STAS domain-containing protein n=1 Tax=Kouleothrix sp. TaxID=2779161 RepID=UPI002B9DF0FF|nr:STAS domain-containing protein [Kouleothrix sp.]HRC75694.1 STAS domain-containing protein [Kouleothrix sp.]